MILNHTAVTVGVSISHCVGYELWQYCLHMYFYAISPAGGCKYFSFLTF